MKFIISSILVLSFTTSLYAQCHSVEECLAQVAEEQSGEAGCESRSSSFLRPSPEGFVAPTSENVEDDLSPSKTTLALVGVAAAPLAFWGTYVIHELSHCIAAESFGYDCYEMKLIPYHSEEHDMFYFASVRHRVPVALGTSAKNEALITAAPMMTNAGLISVYSALAFTDNLPKNPWVKLGTLLMGGFQLVDLGVHISNTKPASDSGKLIHYLKTDHGYSDRQAYWAVKGPQIGFVTLGAAAIALEGKRLFFDRKSKRKDESSLRITPQLSGSQMGLMVGGQF